MRELLQKSMLSLYTTLARLYDPAKINPNTRESEPKPRPTETITLVLMKVCSMITCVVEHKSSSHDLAFSRDCTYYIEIFYNNINIAIGLAVWVCVLLGKRVSSIPGHNRTLAAVVYSSTILQSKQ